MVNKLSAMTHKIKAVVLFCSFLVLSTVIYAQENFMPGDSQPDYGIKKYSSEFFREVYHFNNFAVFMDNINEFVTYQSETTGNFQLPDNLIFSVSGNSYRWNKYYIGDFRINSRLFSGSTFYQPNLYNTALEMDYYNSSFHFNTSKEIENSFSFNYNVGGLGGISPFTKEIINLYHPSASERLYLPSMDRYTPLDYRNKMKGAAVSILNYKILKNDREYQQQLYVDYGTRMQSGFDERGISEYYPEKFAKLQLQGALPIAPNKLFDETNYLAILSRRSHLFTENYFANEESANNQNLSLSLYGVKNREKFKYTVGLTYQSNNLSHNNLTFSRNLVDQDGEAFEPWYPDGQTRELSGSVSVKFDTGNNSTLYYEGYNSLINFSPTNHTFYNTLYAKNIDSLAIPLYVYQWNTNSFMSGLLENKIGWKQKRNLNANWKFSSNLDLTVDGLLLANSSLVRLNWQGQLGFRYSPSDRFAMELNLSRHRVNFNYDDIRFLSDDYLNGDIYYWQDNNQDGIFTEDEQSEYFTSTGGLYHSLTSGIHQPSYITFDFPFYFKRGKHKFSILNTFRKYNNNWIVEFDRTPEEYGYYLPDTNNDYYFLHNGAKQYLVDDNQGDKMETNSSFNFITNSPFYFSTTLRWDYVGEKFYCAISFATYIMAGTSALGNGPLHNDLGILSESSANPNTDYKIIGRYDQERAFVGHFLAAYRLNEKWSFSSTFKFKDGQPFSSFETKVVSDDNGNNQLAIRNNRTKGINPFTQEFGSREDSFFNLEFRTNYRFNIGSHGAELQLLVYNMYDFGTELTEYIFTPLAGERRAMSLNIPRGLMLTGTYRF